MARNDWAEEMAWKLAKGAALTGGQREFYFDVEAIAEEFRFVRATAFREAAAYAYDLQQILFDNARKSEKKV